MSHRVRTVLLALLIIAAPGVVAAGRDKWKAPAPKLYVSPQNEHGLKVIPEKHTNLSDAKARAVLFRLTQNGDETILWKGRLLNIPADAVVDDQPVGSLIPPAFATLDSWGICGFYHSVVLYNGKGDVVRDLKLEDFLTKEEIAAHTTRSVSSRFWRSAAQIEFRDGLLTLDFSWGKTVTVDPENGRIQTHRSRS